MTDFFAHVVDGEIEQYNIKRGSSFNGVSFGKNSPDSTYFTHDLWPIIGVAPELKETEKISGIRYEIGENVVNKVYDIEIIPLDFFKEKKLDEINKIRYSKIYMESIPYLFPEDTEPDGVQMRNDIDRQNIQDVVTDAILRDPGDIMYFMPTSNNLKTMTAQQIKDMGQFVKGRGDTIVAYAWSLKDRVNKAGTIEDLDLIDINAGWPA